VCVAALQLLRGRQGASVPDGPQGGPPLGVSCIPREGGVVRVGSCGRGPPVCCGASHSSHWPRSANRLNLLDHGAAQTDSNSPAAARTPLAAKQRKRLRDFIVIRQMREPYGDRNTIIAGGARRVLRALLACEIVIRELRKAYDICTRACGDRIGNCTRDFANWILNVCALL
jgi:hypothetical protein